MNLFQKCFTGSLLLHLIIIIIYYGPNISALTSSDEEKIYDASQMTFKNVDVDFIDLPSSITMGGDTNPAPVEKEEWIEGTGRDKPDANNTDVNINKLSGTGTDADGYMFADLADRPPSPMVDFNINEYFPKEARSANIFSKMVTLRIQIDEKGSVRSAKVISPPSGYGFDEAAMKVIYRIPFRPGKAKGKPVKMLVDLPLKFEFED
jgi:protein TonB